jgi:hypothetical protein
MKLDKRKKTTKVINRWFNKETRAALVAGLITGTLLGFGLFYPKNSSPEPQGLKINVNPVEVKAIEKPFCKDAIGCIRDIGELQGRSNKTIMTMIRIAQKESSMNPLAKNRNSSARGLFQIIAGTWYSNDCVGDKYNYQDNITCAYKILDGQGLRAWEVCNNGSAKCY